MGNQTLPWLKDELVSGSYIYSGCADTDIAYIHMPGGRTVQVVSQTGVFLLGEDGNTYTTPHEKRRRHGGV